MSTASVLGVVHTPPDFEVPAGACDCHVHVFDPAYPFSAKRVFTPGPATVEDLLAHQRAMRFDRVVLVQPSPYGTDNRCLKGALNRLGRQARGIAVIDSTVSEAELNELHELGVRGVRINLETGGERNPEVAQAKLREAAQLVAGRSWHVQIYAHVDVVIALSDTLASLPAPVMIDHYAKVDASAGVNDRRFRRLLELLRQPRLHIKLSAPHRISSRPDHADAAEIVQAILEVAPDRAVWATDWPHGGAWPGVPRTPEVVEPFHPVDDGLALNRMASWIADRAALERLLVSNPARLYDF